MKNEFIKSGLILGLISIVVTIILYLVSVETMVSLWMIPFSILLTLFVICWLGIKYRKEEADGYLTYGNSYGFSFVSIIVSGVVTILFSLILHNVIDTSLAETLTDASFEQQLNVVRFFGANPDDLPDDTLSEMREKSRAKFTNGGLLKGMIGVVIFSAIISLISAAIIKKKRPETDLI